MPLDLALQDEEEFEWHKREAAQEWDLVRKAVHFNLPKASQLAKAMVNACTGTRILKRCGFTTRHPHSLVHGCP